MIVGVVVIGRNEGARLACSLQSVLDQNVPLVYVDSGSSDGSLDLAKQLGVVSHSLSGDTPFSAARGRNAGFLEITRSHPEIKAVLFLDGDCTIDEFVIPACAAALEHDKKLALVCSPVRETDAHQSIWKLLCDLEWDQPPGPITHCGGIFLIRCEAFWQIGGMDPSVVAGEEPELCLMLQRSGWKLRRIAEGLVLHDVGEEFGFSSWWLRSRRAGLAFLLGFLRDGFTPERKNLRVTLRPWGWSIGIPACALLLSFWSQWSWCLFLIYPFQIARMTLRGHWRNRSKFDALINAVFNLIGQFAQASGQTRLLLDITLGSAPSPRNLRTRPLLGAGIKQRKTSLKTSSIGIVVIGRNEGERLRRCLGSLDDYTDYLVYVDSGSTDDSVVYVKSLGCEVVDLDMSQPFTAARARNAGFSRLREIVPNLDFIQFVDGDCSVDPDWIRTGSLTLQEKNEVVAVTGRRREKYPNASVYNRLADLEWNTPIGPAKSCGGDVLMRADVLAEAGGYDSQLIACEEPELCFRLRSLGWVILRLDVEMTLHDANITHFSQWWKRSTRTGYAYLQASELHRREPGSFLRQRMRSGLIWGFGFPCLLVLSFFEPKIPIFLAAILLFQIRRILQHQRGKGEPASLKFAFFTILINLPIAIGMLRYFAFRIFGRQSKIIEYK